MRGGFGVFHERYRQNNLNFDGLGNPPLSYTPRLFGGNVDEISPALVNAGVRFPVTAVGVSREGHPPKIYSWYAGVQRQLPWRFAIDAAYVGNRGTHFAYLRNINQLPLGYTIANPPPNNTPDAIRPYRGYTAVNIIEFGAESEYHGLQARLTRRFGQRFTANVGYTLSKALDHVDADNNADRLLPRSRPRMGTVGLRPAPPAHHRLRLRAAECRDEVVQQRVRPRRCSTAGSSSGISRFWSGQPLTINSNGNPGTTGGGVRADYIGGDLYPAEQTRLQWFNPLVFGRPADGTLGTTPKGFLRGPGINQWDISLFKNTRVGESRQRPVPARDVQHLQPRAVQRHQYRRQRAERRPGGNRRDARDLGPGHELSCAAPDPGGVEALFLDEVEGSPECTECMDREERSPCSLTDAHPWTRVRRGSERFLVALRCSAAPARLTPAAQQPPGSPAGGSSTAGVFAPVKDARARPITAGGFVDGAPVVFEDRTAGSGLEAFRHRSGSPEKTSHPRRRRRAASRLVDIDNDGWLDIYLVNGSTRAALKGLEPAPRAALFRNNHNLTFTDVTDRAGVGNERWGFGVAAGDFDNDGWTDLYVTNYGTEPPVSQQPRRHLHRRRRAHGRRRRRLVHRRELRRLRRRRPPRSVRRRLRGHRSRAAADAARPTPCALSRRAGDVRTARAARRAATGCSTTRATASSTSPRAPASATPPATTGSPRPGSTSTTTAISICWWSTTPPRTISIATRGKGTFEEVGFSVRLRAERGRPRTGGHGARARRLRQRRPRRRLHHQLLGRLQHAAAQPRRRPRSPT